jgi:N-hydroxyarylamine O-acetyltransferase
MTLAPALVERVLARLGLTFRPEPTLEGLKMVYGAWCLGVPFDNVRKLIHLRRQERGALPGDTASDFFEAWLRHGTGGTCWAGNGALQALLHTLGFDARRGLATMLVVPDIAPNHGTVVVSCEQQRYLVDASILHGEPLALEPNAPSAIAHPAWGVQCRMRDDKWHIRWRPLHLPDGIDCRIEQLDVTEQLFHERHEDSRPWSPFNYALSARRNRDGEVLGAAFGQRVDIGVDGNVRQSPLLPAQRSPLLVQELGMDAALIAQLPADLPTPPPPGSAAARRAAAAPAH